MTIQPSFKLKLIAATGFLLCSTVAQVAQAGFIGTTISQCSNSVYTGTVTVDTSACDSFVVQATPNSAVVGAGVEFNIAENRFFDFGDDSLSIRYVQPVGSPSPDLLIFDLGQTITGISLVGANVLDVSWVFLGESLGMLVNSPLLDGTVNFHFDFAPTSVPEPATLGIMSLGLLGIGFGRRRKTVG